MNKQAKRVTLPNGTNLYGCPPRRYLFFKNIEGHSTLEAVDKSLLFNLNKIWRENV